VGYLNQNTGLAARNTRAAAVTASTASTEDKAPAQAVKSEQLSFNDLVKLYRTPLYRFVVRHIGNPADAEDIAQQTFVEAYSAFATFRGQSQVSTWLYGIAMNLVRNYLNRAPHRVRKYESDEVLNEMADATDGPDALIERMELFTRLYAEVDTLSDELRQTFLLVAIEGRSYEEAAQSLNVPIGTVRSRLFRAREAIKVRIPDLHEALVA
jgi:RNA polymerase sigma factor (sigma-70 family)